MPNKKISVIIPSHNEAANAGPLYERLVAVIDRLGRYDWELIYVDDGSTDGTIDVLRGLAAKDGRVKFIEFSRNFGKEAATSAGLIAAASSDAAIMIDADLQHPPELLPEFLAGWENGADVVVGVRRLEPGLGWCRRKCDDLYYWAMNSFSDLPLMPRATDYRLLDRRVVTAFARFSERDRLTRGLIAWMGYRRAYVDFDAAERHAGTPAYSRAKLVKLALSSFVAHSLLPLKLAGYLGLVITALFGLAGLAVLLGKYVFETPFFVSFTGVAQLAILLVFLVGIVLSCLGLVALYVGSIQKEVLNRPLYLIRDDNLGPERARR